MIQYNDYELLYLMNEFNEDAEKIFYDKYLSMIKSNVNKLNVKERYKDDYIQEGLYMLMVAIRTYDVNSEKTFNKYFELILRRRLIRLLSKEREYLYNVDLIENEYTICEPNEFVYDDEETIKESSLSSFEMQVLLLKEKNYRPKDIAKVLSCDVKTIYNCLYRIKDKIKR